MLTNPYTVEHRSPEVADNAEMAILCGSAAHTEGALRYRPDWLEARARLTSWWHGDDLGRPSLCIRVPNPSAQVDIPYMPEPDGWITDYSVRDIEYRLNIALRRPALYDYFGEAAPTSCVGDLAPNCVALYLGCEGVETPGTVWCRPWIEHPEEVRLAYDAENAYWQYTQQTLSYVAKVGKGRLLQDFPDLVEGLDTLEAMRGAGQLMEDLYDRPEWVHAMLRRITDLYFRYYDVIYDIIRDEVGGSCYWTWAPGRMAKFQCDVSAMLSPAMFGEFMVPVLDEMTRRVSYSMYHWDGPSAIPHHDHLLALPKLDAIQWTPGAGTEPVCDPCWFPLYHKTLDAGKKLFLTPFESIEQLLPFKREFGARMKDIMFVVLLESRDEAERCLRVMEYA